MKKKWKRPELTVLMRGKTEEWVLGTCKQQYGNGPSQSQTGCMNVGGTGACQGHCKKKKKKALLTCRFIFIKYHPGKAKVR